MKRFLVTADVSSSFLLVLCCCFHFCSFVIFKQLLYFIVWGKCLVVLTLLSSTAFLLVFSLTAYETTQKKKKESEIQQGLHERHREGCKWRFLFSPSRLVKNRWMAGAHALQCDATFVNACACTRWRACKTAKVCQWPPGDKPELKLSFLSFLLPLHVANMCCWMYTIESTQPSGANFFSLFYYSGNWRINNCFFFLLIILCFLFVSLCVCVCMCLCLLSSWNNL